MSQTAWFKNWLRGYIVAEANKYLNGQLSIQRLGGNLFFGVEMENIGVSMDGSEVVAVEDLGLKYNVFEMITRGLSVDEIVLNKPVIYLRREGDAWSITRGKPSVVVAVLDDGVGAQNRAFTKDGTRPDVSAWIKHAAVANPRPRADVRKRHDRDAATDLGIRRDKGTLAHIHGTVVGLEEDLRRASKGPVGILVHKL